MQRNATNNLTPVFVYGTLLTNHGNWAWALAPQQGTPAATIEKYRFEDGPGFPYVGHATGRDKDARRVKGEIFWATDEQLESLDRLEGHPDHYRRELVTVQPTDEPGDTQQAWMYIAARPLTGSPSTAIDAGGFWNWNAR